MPTPETPANVRERVYVCVGCGIQTAPATGEVGASMLLKKGLPESYKELGLQEADLVPARVQQP